MRRLSSLNYCDVQEATVLSCSKYVAKEGWCCVKKLQIQQMGVIWYSMLGPAAIICVCITHEYMLQFDHFT